MRKFIAFTLLTLLFIGCKGEESGGTELGEGDSEEVARLKSDLREMENQLSEKDEIEASIMSYRTCFSFI